MFHLLLAIIYLSFISLGLPDSVLGSAWPVMHQKFDVPVSYAGIIATTISLGTVLSSLQSHRLTHKYGTAMVTACSVALTAIALWGFSVSTSFPMLFLWTIPYGVGAGCVDASINNYVALHYASKHMNWLHCMWGIGASAGPYIMSYALTTQRGFEMGYRYISLLQFTLTIILFLSIPLWKKNTAITQEKTTPTSNQPYTLKQLLSIPGSKEIMVAFFCYCALEQTAGLWASSYLTLYCGLSPEKAAGYAAMFYLGITLGRGISGFISIKLNNTAMIRLGECIIFLGIATLLLPLNTTVSLIGLVLIGLGCAPIYPCIIHSTPHHFGADKSQAMIGIQMASAYIGTCVMPPIFGFLTTHIGIVIYPFCLLALLCFMCLLYEKLLKKL